MARRLRVQYEGAIYHVMSRGDRREDIFKDERDRETFIETLGQCCDRTGWEVHALCLMANHFHLVVPKGHQLKVRVAMRLRAQTTVRYEWIARRLHMGSRSYASNLV